MNYMSCFIYIVVTNCTPVSHDDATDTSHDLAKPSKSFHLFYPNSEFVQHPNVRTAMMKRNQLLFCDSIIKSLHSNFRPRNAYTTIQNV